MLVERLEILKQICMDMEVIRIREHSLRILLSFNGMHKFKKFGIKPENCAALGMISMKKA